MLISIIAKSLDIYYEKARLFDFKNTCDYKTDLSKTKNTQL